MEIKLYNENDTRPNGSYTKVRKARIYHSAGVLRFISQSGEQIYTNMKFKIKNEEKERIEPDNYDSYLELASKLE